MNEITRIHIAKTAYDIEIAAKKQLEKYIKSLESYTQDTEVLQDIEIRITELLGERGVKAGGVISSDDVVAIRAQLGEPHEFADTDGDIATGAGNDASNRRLYRSTDDAVLGGVLSGIAGYFNVNPLWTRLVFVLLLFISFGFASVLYVLFWIIVPPARTAAEKLRLAGKDVTLESIKQLNTDEDKAYPNRVAPVLQRIVLVSLGVISALAALGTFIATVWLSIAALTVNTSFVDMTNQFTGLGNDYIWLVQLLFWITVFGLLLLSALFGLIAYAFFAKKLTKKMLISGIVIVILGVASVSTVVGVGATQSVRVANESRSMSRETKVTLPKEFSEVTAVSFEHATQKRTDSVHGPVYSSPNVSLRYIVDEGPARYELSGLPTTKAVVKIDGSKAVVSVDVPDSFRNAFVQPILTIYGPALSSITTAQSAQLNYYGQTQKTLSIAADTQSYVIATGTYDEVKTTGGGAIDLGMSIIKALDVQGELGTQVTAGTIRTLTVTQPDVCPMYNEGSSVVHVAGVTSGEIIRNGATIPVKDHETACASISIESNDTYGEAEL